LREYPRKTWASTAGCPSFDPVYFEHPRLVSAQMAAAAGTESESGSGPVQGLPLIYQDEATGRFEVGEEAIQFLQ